MHKVAFWKEKARCHGSLCKNPAIEAQLAIPQVRDTEQKIHLDQAGFLTHGTGAIMNVSLFTTSWFVTICYKSRKNLTLLSMTFSFDRAIPLL